MPKEMQGCMHKTEKINHPSSLPAYTNHAQHIPARFLQILLRGHYRILNGLIAGMQQILFKPITDKSVIRKVLIFRTGSLGDSICALPAIYSICKNFPHAQIDILTNAGAKDLVSMGALIDKTLVNDIIDYYGLPKNQLFQKLRASRYDLFIQLPQYDAPWWRQARDILIARAIGVKYAFGWQVACTRFLAHFQARWMRFTNERDRLLQILVQNGLQNFGYVYPLAITRSIKEKVHQLVFTHALTHKQDNIGLVVGAKRLQNLWPIEYFKKLADEWRQRGKNILIFGGAGDRARAAQINGERIFNFCGELTPLETAEMMKYCSLIVSNDTGPMHMAYAVGTPVIAIFSGHDYPGKWYPPDDGKNIVLRSDILLCKKCSHGEAQENTCLKRIDVQEVINMLR